MHRNALVRALLVLVCLLGLIPSAHADRSGVRPEVLQMPSGPGSIEGLGESFEPNPNTGTSSYSVEISVPPGVVGFVPSLTLGYSSGGGNGEIGLGWNIGLPMVQRGTDRGLPQYDADDVIVLRGMGGSGAEDLVQMPDASYRFRIEGAFARGRWLADGSWLFVNRSGVKFRFGTTSTSTINDGGSRVFAWLLTEQEDTHGNRIVYEYQRDATGKPYLSRVVYNDFSPSVRNEVLFEYESRPDALTSYLSTFSVTTARRLRRIVVQHGGAPVRSYDLTYADGDGISRMSSVTMTGRDGVTRLPTLSLEYAQLDTNAMSVVTMTSAPARALGTTTELDDVDGDALPDLLVMDPSLDGGAYSYYPNLDGLSFGPRTVMTGTPSVWLDSQDVQLADMDGDGASDVVARVSNASDGFRYYPGGSATTFGARVTITPNQSAGFEDANVRLVDLNHDRLTDWMRIDPTTGVVFVAYNQGGGTFSAGASRPVLDLGEVVSFSAGANLVDCNGDGLTDVVLFRSGSFRCWANRGEGYFAGATSVANTPLLPTNEVATAEVRDINGDGLPDIVHVGVSQVRFWLNRGGNAFGGATAISGTPTNEPSTVVRVADMNGNGSADIVWIDPTRASAWQYLDLLSHGSPGLLTRIDNGLGKVTRLEYAGIGAMRAWARASTIDWSNRSGVGQCVITRITVDDSLGNVTESQMHYASALFDAASRTWRGFAVAQKIDVGDASTNSLVVDSHFDLGASDETRAGLELETSRRMLDGRRFERVRSDYLVRDVAIDSKGHPIRYASQTRRSVELFELGLEATTIVEGWERDDYGNVTAEFRYGRVEGANVAVGSDEFVVRKTFATNASSWILDRVATETVESLSGEVHSEKRYFYDGPDFVGMPGGSVGNIGALKRVESRIDSSTISTIDAFSVDTFGNISAHRDARGGEHVREYDAGDHTFVAREWSMSNVGITIEWNATFDRAHGGILALRDPNGHVQRVEYDPLGRVAKIFRPSDSDDTPTLEYQYSEAAPISHVRHLQRNIGASGAESVRYEYFDGLGRERMKAARASNSQWVKSDIVAYDTRGNVVREYEPLFSTNGEFELAPSVAFRSRTWDATGRSLRTTHADGTSVSFEWAPLTRVVHDESASSPAPTAPRRYRTDGLERLISVEDLVVGAPLMRRYSYDALGNIAAIVQADGLVRTYRFDSRSRRVGLSDPTSGDWRFEYDNAGALVRRTDANGNVVEYDYDVLGRVLEERHGAAGSGTTVFSRRTYDIPSERFPWLENVIGRVSMVEDQVGEAHIGYDESGNGSDTVRVWHDGSVYPVWFDFDSLGNAVRSGYPDGTHIDVEYDALARLARVGPFLQVSNHTPFGAWTSRVRSNGVSESRTFDSRARIRTIRTEGMTGEVVLALTLDHDASSRLIARRDDAVPEGSSVGRTATFEYDRFNRLSAEIRPGGATRFTYDIAGRLMRQELVGNGDRTVRYDANGRIDAINDVAVSSDPSGRILNDGERTLEWDGSGRATSVTRNGVTERYLYDFNGRRAEKLTFRNGHLLHSTRYVDPSFEVEDGQAVRYVEAEGRRLVRIDGGAADPIASTAHAVSEPSHRRTAAAGVSWGLAVAAVLGLLRSTRSNRSRARGFALAVIAMIVACGPNSGPTDPRRTSRAIDSAPESAVHFMLDERDSVVAAVAEDGTVVSRAGFSAFGEREVEGAGERIGYLGNEHDTTTGFADFGARLYNVAAGVFVSPDLAALLDPQRTIETPERLNDYTYAHGDPVNYEDEDGDLDMGVGRRVAQQSVRRMVQRRLARSIVVNGAIALADSPVVPVLDAVAAVALAYDVYLIDKTATAVNRSLTARMRDLTRRFNGQRYVFVTYESVHPLTGQIYVGMTSGVVRPGESDRTAAQNAIRARWRGRDHRSKIAQGFPIPDQPERYFAGNFDGTAASATAMFTRYGAIRGREQALIEMNGGIGSPGLLNTQNSVGPDNPLRDVYMGLARRHCSSGPNCR